MIQVWHSREDKTDNDNDGWLGRMKISSRTIKIEPSVRIKISVIGFM